MTAPAPIANTSFERVELPLEAEFTISRGTTKTIENVIVRIEDEYGRVGIGGAVPSAYYEESVEDIESTMHNLLGLAKSVGDPTRTVKISARMAAEAPAQGAARAAVSIALHDLVGQQAEEPLYRRLGLTPEQAPPTSYSIGIDSPAGMARTAQRAVQAGHQILKVKLGTDDDRARIRAIRKTAPGARIRVDANGDWTVEEAIEKSNWLANAGVEFVEQPVPADDIDGLGRVSKAGFLPVAADESCVTAGDVPAVADAADIVVVKLLKCGGIRPALCQIETAKAHELDVMIGCMVQSNAGIAGSCHLAPLAKYIDLDGALLLGADRYTGVPQEHGHFDLTAVESGTGVAPIDDAG